MDKKCKKLNENDLYALSVNLNICDSVVELLDNIHLSESDKNNLFEVLVSPLSAVLNFYVVYANAPFGSVLMGYHLDVNGFVVHNKHYNQRLTHEDKKTMVKAYKLCKKIFETYKGGEIYEGGEI